MTALMRPIADLPTIGPDGTVMQHAGRYAKNAVLTVFDMLGGTRGLAEWALKNPANEADYYTKIFPKTIQKDVEVKDSRSIEDVLAALDGEFTVVENGIPAVASPQDFSNFSSFDSAIVIGDVDEDVGEVSE